MVSCGHRSSFLVFCHFSPIFAAEWSRYPYIRVHVKRTAPCRIVPHQIPSITNCCIRVFTARAYARAVLGVVILSVRLSVCLSHAWTVTKLNYALRIFWYHTKGQSFCYSDTNSGVGGRRSLPSEICAQSDPPSSRNADFDRFPLITSQP